MFDPNSLADSLPEVPNTSVDSDDLNQRLGLYRVFLKLYEHHRGLLDEILNLEDAEGQQRAGVVWQYIQGVVQGNQVFLSTNLLQGQTKAIAQPQKLWSIGRDRKAALSIPDKRLSRRHAAIQYISNQGFYLVDLNSTNGTFLNGERIRQRVLLKEGDRVRLGSISFTFFACQTVQVADAVSTEILTQVDTAPTTTPTLEDPVESDAPFEPDTAPTGGSDDTSMFLRAALTVAEDEPEPSVPQLSTSQQSDILDRFLNR